MDWFVFVFLVFFVAMPWSVSAPFAPFVAARRLEGRPPLASLGGYFWGRLISPPGAR